MSAKTSYTGIMKPLRAFAGLFSRDRILFSLLVLICFFVAFLVCGPLFVGWTADDTDFVFRNRGPGDGHLLGTDSLGRDTLARVLKGGQVSVALGALGLLCALLFGAFTGLLACAVGGVVEFLYFGFIDLLRSMPGPLLAITLVVGLGQGTIPVVIALGFIYSPMFARIVRSLYQNEIIQDYVIYSRSNRASRLYVLFKHIIPNLAGAIVTQSVIVYPRAIVTESVLSFLGMGMPPETATWGKMISIESPFFEVNPLAVMVPVVFLSAFTALFAVLGTRIRELSV